MTYRTQQGKQPLSFVGKKKVHTNFEEEKTIPTTVCFPARKWLSSEVISEYVWWDCFDGQNLWETQSKYFTTNGRKIAAW